MIDLKKENVDIKAEISELKQKSGSGCSNVNVVSQGDNSPDDTSVTEVKSLVKTLQTNVIGLGRYINTINREVKSLATRTRESLETETSLISNVFEIETSLISNVFEINGELTGIKTSLESLNNEVNEIKDQQLPELRRGGGQQRQPERAH